MTLIKSNNRKSSSYEQRSTCISLKETHKGTPVILFFLLFSLPSQFSFGFENVTHQTSVVISFTALLMITALLILQNPEAFF